MTPYEALYGRPCRSPVCWMEVGERPSTGPDLIRDTVDPRFSSRASPLDGRDSFFFFCVGKSFKKTVWSRHLFLFYFKWEKQNKKEKP